MKSYWRRFRRRRISRRRLLGAAGVGAAGLTVVAACGGGEEGPAPEETPREGKARYGGRHQVASAGDIDTLDPHLSIAAGLWWFPRTYNVLVRQSAQEPEFIFRDLAEEFEAPQPGGTEWIFTIRPGVKIAPNTLGISARDMDAEDARVSFERIQGLPEANACAFVCEWFASHEAPDPQTYIVKTPKPYAWFLLNIGGTVFASTIPPPEAIEKSEDFMSQNAVGGGPFSVVAYTEGQNLNLDKNPGYYRTDPGNGDAQLPYIDGFDVKIITDRATRRTAFISQQIYEYVAENKEEAEDLLSRHDVYQGSEDPVNTFISFTMNTTRQPWDDPKVRKAAVHALNRQEYIDIVYKGGAKANGLVHWPTGSYALPEDELEELQGFAPEKSKQLIREAGHELPLRIGVMFPANMTFGEHDQHLPIFLEQMKAAGFEIEQDGQDLATWLDNYTNKNYDASLALNQIYETPEIPLDFQHSKGPAGSNVYSNGLQDPEVDAAIEATKEVTDPEELVEAVQNVQRQVYEAGPAFLPIVSPFSRMLYWSFVKNIPTGIGITARLINTWWLEV